MIKGETSIRGGIQDFLCPFTDMYITQGSNGKFSHQGIMANDVRGLEVGIRYPYYAPCDLKCLRVYPSSGQSMWQSLEKVRFANGRVDYATLMIAHDDSQDCFIGQVVKQGEQLGNMGTKGYATGVHCHIQISQSNDINWYKNEFGIYKFNNEYDLDDCYFVDNTNIIEGMGGNWKFLDSVKVEDENPIYKTLYPMNVRYGAGVHYPRKLVKDLTEDGKKNATSENEHDYAVYREGTKFTCYEEFEAKDGSLWAITPSGYVCIEDNSCKYCERV